MRPKKKSKPVGEYILNVLIVLPLTLADPEWGGGVGGWTPSHFQKWDGNESSQKKNTEKREKKTVENDVCVFNVFEYMRTLA